MSEPQGHPFEVGHDDQRRGEMTPLDCTAIHDLAAGSALDALESHDQELVNQHTRTCLACAALLAAFERTASALPYLSRIEIPPPDVKMALFSRIAQAQARADQPAPPVSAEPNRPSTIHAIPGATATIPASRERMSPPVAVPDGRRGAFQFPLRRRAGSWRSYSLPVATTAIPLVLALALVGGWAYSLYGDAVSARDDQSFMGTFSSVVAGGDGNLFELTSSATAQGAEGQFLASMDGNNGILTVSGLKPEQADQAYEVWIEQDGEMYRYDTLDVDSRGNSQMLIEVDGTFKRCRGVYIQLAPANESTGTISEVLWTSLSNPGPANGDNETEGDPEIGTSSIATVPLSTK